MGIQNSSTLFRVLIFAAVVTLFACGEKKVPDQGKATWERGDQSGVPDGASKERALEVSELDLDYQQMMSDLDILQKPPDTGKAASIEAQIDSIHHAQRQYDEVIIKSWIDSIAAEDEIVSRTIHYGRNQKIHFVNEPKLFVDIFESMLVKKGSARVPVLIVNKGQSNEITEYVTVPIGGDPVPVLDGRPFRDRRGSLCSTVICALTAVFGSEAAAYDVLFIHLKYRYLISLMCPRDFVRYEAKSMEPHIERLPRLRQKLVDSQRAEARYQQEKTRCVIFTPEQVRVIADSLWRMPKTFWRMIGLTAFVAVKLDKGQVDMGIGSVFGTYHPIGNKGIESAGSIKINTDQFSPTLEEFRGELGPGRQREIDQLLARHGNEFSRRYAEVRRDRDIFYIIHELAHAFDYSASTELKGPGISYSDKWLGFSGWRSISSKPGFKVERRNQWQYLTQLQLANTELYSIVERDRDYVITNPEYDFPAASSQQFFSAYAKRNPKEDFAEHVAAVALFPGLVKQVANAKFDFIRHTVFNSWPISMPKNYRIKMEPIR